jgi:hypothetical protein
MFSFKFMYFFLEIIIVNHNFLISITRIIYYYLKYFIIKIAINLLLNLFILYLKVLNFLCFPMFISTMNILQDYIYILQVFILSAVNFFKILLII